MATKIMHNGCEVEVYKHDGEWCLKIGMNVYRGYKTKRLAVGAISRWI